MIDCIIREEVVKYDSLLLLLLIAAIVGFNFSM
jgi:hypothetical protein